MSFVGQGVQYSVRDIVNAAAQQVGMTIRWTGEGVNEKGYLLPSSANQSKVGTEGNRPIVAVDPRYFRPTEVETLRGDPSKARNKLGWTPKTSFDELVKKHGYKAPNHHE